MLPLKDAGRIESAKRVLKSLEPQIKAILKKGVDITIEDNFRLGFFGESA